MSEQSSSGDKQSAASKLFDIRLMIGGLFVLYGVILVIYGLVASKAEIAKAAGINMNLWMGVGMLVVGLLFLLWRRLNPEGGHAEANPTGVTDTDEPRGH